MLQKFRLGYRDIFSEGIENGYNEIGQLMRIIRQKADDSATEQDVILEDFFYLFDELV